MVTVQTIEYPHLTAGPEPYDSELWLRVVDYHVRAAKLGGHSHYDWCRAVLHEADFVDWLFHQIRVQGGYATTADIMDCIEGGE